MFLFKAIITSYISSWIYTYYYILKEVEYNPYTGTKKYYAL